MSGPTARRASVRPGALAFVAALLLLAACGTASSQPEPTADAPAAGTETDAAPVEGTFWRLVQVADEDGTLAEVPPGVQATARFTDSGLGGSTGCNTYGGDYTLDGESLEVGQLMQTLIACEGPAAMVESAMLAALGSVTTATVESTSDGTTLTLSDDAGSALLVFEAAEALALVGTAWSATQVNNGKGAVTGVIAGTEITAVFDEDGAVSGSAGCNTYRGEYTLDGSNVQVGPLASTKKACPEPPGAMEQEQQFLAALERSTTVELDPDGLSLRDDQGALQVAFAPGG